jgi:hypothetical protein
VRGREHDARRTLLVDQAGGEIEAVQAGHLDVEEDDVGRQFVDETQRFDAVAGASDDAQFRPGERQLFVEVGQQMRFVVGKQGADGVDDGTSAGLYTGRIRREVTPPSWFSSNCS